MAYRPRKRSNTNGIAAAKSPLMATGSDSSAGATGSQQAAAGAGGGEEGTAAAAPATPPIKRNLYVRSLPQEARRGNVEAVRQLVEEHGASLDEEVVGETALHFASFYGHLPVVTYLLSRPECRLNKRNLGGNTPLMRAVENGHAGVVALLLDAARQRQRPIAKRRNMKGETALHKAAATGNVEVARLLVEQGRGSVDVSARTHADHGGDTPLHVAAERGHWPMVGYLLSIRDESAAHDAAAAAAQAPSSDPTPVAAATSGAPPVVSAGRTTIPRPLRSVSPVVPSAAAQRARRANIAHVDARNTKGRTAAHMPIVSGKRDMKESERLEGVKLMAEAGADLNARDASGRTPLHWAVFSNYTRIVQYLLGLGPSRVDASIADVCEYTPAHIAVNWERELLAHVLEQYVGGQPWEHLLARLVEREQSGEAAAEEAPKRKKRGRRARQEKVEEEAEEEAEENDDDDEAVAAELATKRRRSTRASAGKRRRRTHDGNEDAEDGDYETKA